MAGDRRSFDPLVDVALEAYLRAEPRPGMEQRVLNRIRAEGAPHTFPSFRWLYAAMAVACLAAGAAIWNLRTPTVAPPAMMRVTHNPPPAAASAETVEPVRKWKKRTRRGGVPRKDEFPMREPLTGQERALIGIVRGASADALLALNDDKVIDIEPLPEIEPLYTGAIELPPLPCNDSTK